MDAERRVDQAADHLRAYLPVAIERVNADGGVQLEQIDPSHILAGGRDLIPPDQHPAVEVAIAQTETLRIDVASREGDTTYPVTAVAHVHDTDYEALWRKMYRWGRALSLALSMRDVLEDGSATVRVQAYYGIEIDDAGREYPVWIAKPRVVAMIECVDEVGGVL